MDGFFRTIGSKLGVQGARQAVTDEDEVRRLDEAQQRQQRLLEARQAFEAAKQAAAAEAERKAAQLQQARSWFDQAKAGAGTLLQAGVQGARAGAGQALDQAIDQSAPVRTVRDVRQAMQANAEELPRQQAAFRRENPEEPLPGGLIGGTAPGVAISRAEHGLSPQAMLDPKTGYLRKGGPVEDAIRRGPIGIATGRTAEQMRAPGPIGAVQDITANTIMQTLQGYPGMAQSIEQGQTELRAAETGRTGEERTPGASYLPSVSTLPGAANRPLWRQKPGEAPKTLSPADRAGMATRGLTRIVPAAMSMGGPPIYNVIPAVVQQTLQQAGMDEQEAETIGNVVGFLTRAGGIESPGKALPGSVGKFAVKTGALSEEERLAGELLTRIQRAKILGGTAAGAGAGAAEGVVEAREENADLKTTILKALSGAADIAEIGGSMGEGAAGAPRGGIGEDREVVGSGSQAPGRPRGRPAAPLTAENEAGRPPAVDPEALGRATQNREGQEGLRLEGEAGATGVRAGLQDVSRVDVPGAAQPGMINGQPMQDAQAQGQTVRVLAQEVEQAVASGDEIDLASVARDITEAWQEGRVSEQQARALRDQVRQGVRKVGAGVTDLRPRGTQPTAIDITPPTERATGVAAHEVRPGEEPALGDEGTAGVFGDEEEHARMARAQDALFGEATDDPAVLAQRERWLREHGQTVEDQETQGLQPAETQAQRERREAQENVGVRRGLRLGQGEPVGPNDPRVNDGRPEQNEEYRGFYAWLDDLEDLPQIAGTTTRIRNAQFHGAITNAQMLDLLALQGRKLRAAGEAAGDPLATEGTPEQGRNYLSLRGTVERLGSVDTADVDDAVRDLLSHQRVLTRLAGRDDGLTPAQHEALQTQIAGALATLRGAPQTPQAPGQPTPETPLRRVPEPPLMRPEAGGQPPAGERAGVWFSQLERVLQAKFRQPRMPAPQVRQLLLGSGVKKEELFWTGVDEFLAQHEAEKKPVERDALARFARANRLPLVESLLGYEERGPTTPEEVALRRRQTQASVDRAAERARERVEVFVQAAQPWAERVAGQLANPGEEGPVVDGLLRQARAALLGDEARQQRAALREMGDTAAPDDPGRLAEDWRSSITRYISTVADMLGRQDWRQSQEARRALAEAARPVTTPLANAIDRAAAERPRYVAREEGTPEHGEYTVGGSTAEQNATERLLRVLPDDPTGAAGPSSERPYGVPQPTVAGQAREVSQFEVGGHFGGRPGIVGSNRQSDATLEDGISTVHSHENQTDLGQKGRKYGTFDVTQTPNAPEPSAQDLEQARQRVAADVRARQAGAALRAAIDDATRRGESGAGREYSQQRRAIDRRVRDAAWYSDRGIDAEVGADARVLEGINDPVLREYAEATLAQALADRDVRRQITEADQRRQEQRVRQILSAADATAWGEYWGQLQDQEAQGVAVDPDELWEAENRANAAENALQQDLGQRDYQQVPRAPFPDTTIIEKLIERQLRDAVDRGAGAISWSPGQVQARRWSAGSFIGGAQYDPATQTLYIWRRPRGGDPAVTPEANADRAIEHVPPEKLTDYVSADVARALQDPANDPGGEHNVPTYSLTEFRSRKGPFVAGERMLALDRNGKVFLQQYDKTAVGIVNKLAKAAGSKNQVRPGRLQDPGDGRRYEPEDLEAWVLDIDDALRRHAQQGFALYHRMEGRRFDTGEDLNPLADEGITAEPDPQAEQDERSTGVATSRVGSANEGSAEAGEDVDVETEAGYDEVGTGPDGVKEVRAKPRGRNGSTVRADGRPLYPATGDDKEPRAGVKFGKLADDMYAVPGQGRIAHLGKPGRAPKFPEPAGGWPVLTLASGEEVRVLPPEPGTLITGSDFVYWWHVANGQLDQVSARDVEPVVPGRYPWERENAPSTTPGGQQQGRMDLSPLPPYGATEAEPDPGLAGYERALAAASHTTKASKLSETLAKEELRARGRAEAKEAERVKSGAPAPKPPTAEAAAKTAEAQAARRHAREQATGAGFDFKGSDRQGTLDAVRNYDVYDVNVAEATRMANEALGWTGTGEQAGEAPVDAGVVEDAINLLAEGVLPRGEQVKKTASERGAIKAEKEFPGVGIEYVSSKTGEPHWYDSLYEVMMAILLDRSPKVATWSKTLGKRNRVRFLIDPTRMYHPIDRPGGILDAGREGIFAPDFQARGFAGPEGQPATEEGYEVKHAAAAGIDAWKVAEKAAAGRAHFTVDGVPFRFYAEDQLGRRRMRELAEELATLAEANAPDTGPRRGTTVPETRAAAGEASPYRIQIPGAGWVGRGGVKLSKEGKVTQTLAQRIKTTMSQHEAIHLRDYGSRHVAEFNAQNPFKSRELLDDPMSGKWPELEGNYRTQAANHNTEGGSTVFPAGMPQVIRDRIARGEPVYMVAVAPARSQDINDTHDIEEHGFRLARFHADNDDFFNDFPQLAIGTWKGQKRSAKTGKLVKGSQAVNLDLSMAVADRDTAQRLGEQFRQEALWDLTNSEAVPVDENRWAPKPTGTPEEQLDASIAAIEDAALRDAEAGGFSFDERTAARSTGRDIATSRGGRPGAGPGPGGAAGRYPDLGAVPRLEPGAPGGAGLAGEVAPAGEAERLQPADGLPGDAGRPGDGGRGAAALRGAGAAVGAPADQAAPAGGLGAPGRGGEPVAPAVARAPAGWEGPNPNGPVGRGNVETGVAPSPTRPQPSQASGLITGAMVGAPVGVDPATRRTNQKMDSEAQPVGATGLKWVNPLRGVGTAARQQDPAINKVMLGQAWGPDARAARKNHGVLADGWRQAFDLMQQALLAKGTPDQKFANAEAYGIWSVGTDMAVNVPPIRGRDQGQNARIAYNPHAVFSDVIYAMTSAGRSVASFTPETWRRAIARNMAYQLAQDLVHELTHNEIPHNEHDRDPFWKQRLHDNLNATLHEQRVIAKQLQALLEANDYELLSQIAAETGYLHDNGVTAGGIYEQRNPTVSWDAILKRGGPAERGLAYGATGSLTARGLLPGGADANGAALRNGTGRGTGPGGLGRGVGPTAGEGGLAADAARPVGPGGDSVRPGARGPLGAGPGAGVPGRGLDVPGAGGQPPALRGGAAGAGGLGEPGGREPGEPGGPGGLGGRGPAGPAYLGPTGGIERSPGRDIGRTAAGAGSGAGASGAVGAGAAAGAAPGGAAGKQRTAPSKWETANAATKLGMLLSPNGLLRQFVGNFGTALWQPTERAVAGGLATLNPMETGIGEDVPTFREAGAMAKSYFANFPGALKAMRESLDTANANANAQAAGASTPGRPEPTNATHRKIANALDVGFRWLSIFDAATKYATAQAEREALQTRNRIRGAQGKATMDPADIEAHALAAGKYRTLTQDMDTYGKAIEGVQHTPLGEVLIPFWAIPYNGMKYDLERSALGLGKTLWQEAFDRKSQERLDATERYERVARGTIGTALSLALVGAYAAGGLTGPEPDDPEEMKQWRAEGKKPFSVRVGDRWVPVTLVPGLNASLTQAATVGDFWRRHDLEGRAWDANEYKRAVTRLVNTTATYAVTRPFFEGIADILGSGQRQVRGDEEEPGVVSTLAKQAAGRVTSFPGRRMLREAERATSDTDRVATSEPERVLADIPFLSSRLPERRDAFGRVQKRTGSGLERVLNPLLGSADRGSPRRFQGSSSGERDTAVAEAVRAVEKERDAQKKGVPLPANERPTQRQRNLAQFAMKNPDYAARQKTEKERKVKAGVGGGGSLAARLV